MKKTFKRFLSSALAAVMAASVLSVGMVTSASAEDLALDKIDTWDAGDEMPTWLTSDGTSNFTMPAEATGNMAENIFDGNTQNDIAGRTSLGLASGKNIKITIKGNAELKIYAARNSSSDAKFKTPEYVNGSSNLNKDTQFAPKYSTNNIEPITITLTPIDNAKESTYTFKSNHSTMCIFRIVLSYNEAANVVIKKTVDVTAKDFTTGDSINSITVSDASGKAVSPESGSQYSLIQGNEYTVSADGYASETFTVTEDTTNVELELLSTSVTGETFDLSKLQTTDGQQIAASYSTGKFLVGAGVYQKSGYIRVAKDAGSDIQFKVTTKSKIKFTGIKSSNSSNTRTLQLKKVGVDDPVGEWKTSGTEIEASIDVDPGTYAITTPDATMQFKTVTIYGTLEDMTATATISKATAGNAATVLYDKNCYAVAVVSKADVDNTENTKVVLQYSNDGSIDNDTVYAAVKFDKEYKATDFSDSASAEDYVFAALVDATEYDSDHNYIGNIQKIKVSVE